MAPSSLSVHAAPWPPLPSPPWAAFPPPFPFGLLRFPLVSLLLFFFRPTRPFLAWPARTLARITAPPSRLIFSIFLMPLSCPGPFPIRLHPLPPSPLTSPRPGPPARDPERGSAAFINQAPPSLLPPCPQTLNQEPHCCVLFSDEGFHQEVSPSLLRLNLTQELLLVVLYFLIIKPSLLHQNAFVFIRVGLLPLLPLPPATVYLLCFTDYW